MSKRLSRRDFLRMSTLVVGTGILVPSLSGCAQPTAAPAAPTAVPAAPTAVPATAAPTKIAVSAVPITMGLSVEPPNLDPHVAGSTSARTVRLLVYRGLFNYGKDSKPSPELAESYTVSSDNLTYTFKLRKATFHNGDPVTAEDVKYSLERILDPKTGAPYRTQMSSIESVTASDPSTVVIKVKTITGPLLDYLCVPESAIVSKAWTEAKGGKLSENPMGAGPYVFKEYLKGQRIVLERYPNFYKAGIPKTERIVFNFYPDANTRSNALRSGDADLVEYVQWKDVPSIKADPNLVILGGTGAFMAVAFNTTSKVFSDARVRRAVGYAIQRSAVINTAFSSQGVPIWGMAVPPTSVAYDAKFDNYFKYDIDAAKKLLADAGYPNGFKARLLATSQYDFHQNTAVAVKAELAKIGIDLELDLPDWATRNEKTLKGDHDMLVIGTAGDVADPDYLSDYYQSGSQRLNNAPGFADTQVDDLLAQGRTTLDPAKRKEIYAKLQERVLEQSPLVFLMWRDQSYGAKKTLQGFNPLQGFLSFQSGITLENATITK